MKLGKFITLEGIEGAGKSTALQFIRDYFAEKHQEILVTREPGGTSLSEEIRQLILHPKSDEVMLADTELLLMFAARAQHIKHCLRPALEAGKWVVSDRYIDASYAYQGGGRQVNLNHIKVLDEMIVGELYPDLTLLLDLSVDLGMARTEQRNSQKDRIEKEQIDFFIRIRKAYLERAKQDPNRIKIIDASKTVMDVSKQIRLILDQAFPVPIA